MPDLPLVDLKAQYAAIREEVRLAIDAVLERQQFISGPETAAFENEFARASGAAHSIAVSNGTTALELTFEALGIGSGDEVITVSHTFFATVEAILRVGATPVLVDVDPDDWTMSAERVAEAVGPRTKAVVPVHIYGHPANVRAIREAAPGATIVEDAAQAHLARYYDAPVGREAAAATFSFFPSKNLGAYGDAGAVTTDDEELAQRLRRLRDHGRSGKYEHAEVGTNARAAELQLAVLRVKLRHLSDWTAERRRLSGLYEQRLDSSFGLQVERPWAEHVRHLFVARHDQRDDIRAALAAQGIASGIHYPLPIHRQPAVTGTNTRVAGTMDVTDALARSILSLPLFPELGDDGVDRVATALETVVAA
ncbi:MAG TPA: DegT/DnrJ/EryC1/StrS family aminotransferase [Gaiellaceae bacterium]|nr:DegT/DnrJ/EryC1/StrS family aminotransferase [Gaiellaceae bacterium]